MQVYSGISWSITTTNKSNANKRWGRWGKALMQRWKYAERRCPKARHKATQIVLVTQAESNMPMFWTKLNRYVLNLYLSDAYVYRDPFALTKYVYIKVLIHRLFKLPRLSSTHQASAENPQTWAKKRPLPLLVLLAFRWVYCFQVPLIKDHVGTHVSFIRAHQLPGHS